MVCLFLHDYLASEVISVSVEHHIIFISILTHIIVKSILVFEIRLLVQVLLLLLIPIVECFLDLGLALNFLRGGFRCRGLSNFRLLMSRFLLFNFLNFILLLLNNFDDLFFIPPDLGQLPYLERLVFGATTQLLAGFVPSHLCDGARMRLENKGGGAILR
jgi:hypothetical protein